MTLFTIISTYSPLAAEKSRGTIDRVTTDSPYNEARCTGAMYSWSRLFTWSNHLSLGFLHLSVMFSTFSLSLMSSFLTWSLSVWPHAHLHIFISVTSSFFTWELVTGTVAIPYSIAGWTIILCIFPLTCGGTLLSHRTPDIFLQLFHPHCILLFL